MSRYIKERRADFASLNNFMSDCDGVGLPIGIIDHHAGYGSIEWDCPVKGITIPLGGLDRDVFLQEHEDLLSEIGEVITKSRFVYCPITDDMIGFYVDLKCPLADEFFGILIKVRKVNNGRVGAQ